MMECKDQMAEYVKQLIELDGRTPMNFNAKFAEQLSLEGFGEPQGWSEKLRSPQSYMQAGSPPGLDTPLTVPLPTFAPSWNTAQLPAPVPLPTPKAAQTSSKLVPATVQLAADKDASAGGSNKLQHAANMLQAALANWEACLQNEHEGFPAVHPPVVTPKDNYVTDGYQAMSASSPEWMPSSRVVNMLEKALSDITGGLSPDASAVANALHAQDISPSDKMQLLSWLSGLQPPVEPMQSAAPFTKESLARMAMMFQDNGMVGTVPAGRGFNRPRTVGVAAPVAKSGWPGMGMPSLPGMAPLATMGYAPQGSWPLQAMIPPFPGGSPPMSPQYSPQAQPHKGKASAQRPSTAMLAGNAKRRFSQEEPSSPGPASPGGATQHGETLRMHLRSLLNVDSKRVLIVRKINRLGFASPQVLNEHYSWYGTVERVYVAHSRVKSGTGPSQANVPSRLRPSGLGFIVMSKCEETEAILAEGTEQNVCGALIRVQRFERRMVEDEAEEEEAAGGAEAGACQSGN